MSKVSTTQENWELFGIFGHLGDTRKSWSTVAKLGKNIKAVEAKSKGLHMKLGADTLP